MYYVFLLFHILHVIIKYIYSYGVISERYLR